MVEVGAAWQMWVMAEVGFFCVNFDLIFFFFFFVGHLLDSDFAIGLILILGWIFVWVHGGGVGGCYGGSGQGFYYGSYVDSWW